MKRTLGVPHTVETGLELVVRKSSRGCGVICAALLRYRQRVHLVITITIRDAEWRLQQQLATEIEGKLFGLTRDTLATIRWERTAVDEGARE